MPLANTAKTSAPKGGSATAGESPGARVRVVPPAGGRVGWRAVDAGADPGGLTPCTAAVSAAAARAWLRDYLDGVLERNDRILLILRYVEGLNAREIGAVVEASEASVHFRLVGLNRAMQAAFQCFEEEREAGG